MTTFRIHAWPLVSLELLILSAFTLLLLARIETRPVTFNHVPMMASMIQYSIANRRAKLGDCGDW